MLLQPYRRTAADRWCMTAPTITAFDTLRLADIYAVLSHSLRHADEVDQYLRAREVWAERVRREISAGFRLPECGSASWRGKEDSGPRPC
jgi:hypothetical protein